MFANATSNSSTSASPTSAQSSAAPGSDDQSGIQPPRPDRADARVTGALYLGLAIAGMLGFLAVRPALFADGDPGATASHLIAHASLARVGIVLELAIVTFQALAALWFYRLFRPIDTFAAGAIALFGTINAVMVLCSAAFLASALETALAPGLDAAAVAPHLMYVISNHLWGVTAVFNGLWLIPMGWLVLRAGWAHRALGWLLILGGIGYLTSAFVTYSVAGATSIADVLTLPATVAELWMVGWLLLTGLRPRQG